MATDDITTEAVDRRSVLRAGVIGAAWAVPTVAVLGVGVAHADTPSGGGVLPTQSTSQPPNTTTTDTTVVAAPARQARGQVAAAGQESGALAFTGGEAAPVVALGAALAAGGVALRVASRRGADPGKHQA